MSKKRAAEETRVATKHKQRPFAKCYQKYIDLLAEHIGVDFVCRVILDFAEIPARFALDVQNNNICPDNYPARQFRIQLVRDCRYPPCNCSPSKVLIAALEYNRRSDWLVEENKELGCIDLFTERVGWNTIYAFYPDAVYREFDEDRQRNPGCPPYQRIGTIERDDYKYMKALAAWYERQDEPIGHVILG